MARPTRISSGKRCSLKAAAWAASSAERKGSLYSSANSGMAEAERCGMPSWKVPSTRSMARPSTLVWPDFQKIAAMEKRATKATRL
ncbi:hypothetical protein D3C72_1914870 [compost metagenome]